MKYDLLVISERTLETYPCVCLVFQTNVYMFNCPDLTQRLLSSTKGVKFGRLKNLFITSFNTKSFSGFQGLFMTLLNSKERVFEVTAPDGSEKFMELYMTSRLIPIEVTLVNNFSDENISVKEIRLKNSILFLVKLCDIPGKFDIKKAQELGVKPGPNYSKLQKGECIQLEDGRSISPEQVLGDVQKGDTILFVECITDDDIDMIPENIEFDFVVHFTDIDMVLTDKYMSKFKGSKGICFPKFGRIAFERVYSLYSSISSQEEYSRFIYPICNYNIEIPKLPDSLEVGCSNLSYQFAPIDKKGFQNQYRVEEIDRETRYREIDNDVEYSITFTGTSAAVPGVFRNVTGILVQSGDKFCLFDCGEGTASQLKRIYGENAGIIFSKIDFIYCTHSHGDHVFGLLDFIQTIKEYTDKKIKIFAPEVTRNYIQKFLEISPFKLSVDLLDNDFSTEINGIQIQPIKVQHNHGSHSIVIINQYGKKIVFSGDKGFESEYNSKIDKCDVLIHEATFSDENIEEAISRKHSTVGQTIETARLSKAKNLILTHFSQRSPMLPTGIKENIAFALDYLTFDSKNMNDHIIHSQKIYECIAKYEELEI